MDAPASAIIAQLLQGQALCQAISVAARLEIADMLADGPLDTDELAKRTGTHAPALYRLLRTLASVSVFREDESGRFALTPAAACLKKDADDSQWAIALLAGQEFFRAWGELMHSVQTGDAGFQKAFGKPIFDYLADHPDKARLFDAAMTSVHGRESAAMLDAYDLSGTKSFVDVGGGNGRTLIAVLKRYSAMRGVLFDLPHVVEAAKANIRAAGLDDRMQAEGGSFLERVPAGGDVYLLRHIIHDWYDEQSTQILGCCRQAMRADSRLLIVESVILPGNEPSVGKLLDLAMLVLPGGMERTEHEYRQLLAGAGLRLEKIVPTAADVSVIEARPV